MKITLSDYKMKPGDVLVAAVLEHGDWTDTNVVEALRRRFNVKYVEVQDVKVPAKFGITWATAEHTVAETGYVFETIEEAEEAAAKGPAWAEARSHTVAALCEHFPEHCPGRSTLFGQVELDGGGLVLELTVGDSGSIIIDNRADIPGYEPPTREPGCPQCGAKELELTATAVGFVDFQVLGDHMDEVEWGALRDADLGDPTAIHCRRCGYFLNLERDSDEADSFYAILGLKED